MLKWIRFVIITIFYRDMVNYTINYLGDVVFNWDVGIKLSHIL